MKYVKYLAFSFGLLIFLPILLLGEDDQSFNLSELFSGREIPLYAVDGFFVTVTINDKFPVKFGTEALFKSQIGLALKEHEIKEYLTYEETYNDSCLYNVPTLNCNISYFETEFEDGRLSKNIVFMYTLSVSENLVYSRRQSNTFNKIIGLPGVTCNIWKETIYGVTPRSTFKETIKEFIEDNLIILINDYKTMNSKKTIDWVKKRQDYINSFGK